MLQQRSCWCHVLTGARHFRAPVIFLPCTSIVEGICLSAQEREKILGEEQRKTAEQNARYQAQLSQYEDELARKRQEQEHELNRQRNAELVRMQEESARAKEEQRRVIEEQIQVPPPLQSPPSASGFPP